MVQQMAMHHPGMHPALHPPPNMHTHLQSMDGGQFDQHGMLSDQNQHQHHHHQQQQHQHQHQQQQHHHQQQQQQLFSDHNGGGQGGYGMIAPPQSQQQPMDSPGVMPNFDLQVGLLFSTL
jgi:hypothetical protein